MTNATIILEDGRKMSARLDFTGAKLYESVCRFVQIALTNERENIKYKLVLE